MPNWIPGRTNGEPVDIQFNNLVKIKLDESQKRSNKQKRCG